MIRTLPVILAMLLLAACVGEDDSVGQGTPPPGDFLVPVRLSNFEIEVAHTPPAGELTFQIENEGDQRHAFAIEGNGVNETLVTDVAPGSTETATIELEPGTYTVWCPIGDHRERGMEAQLEVTEPTQADGAPEPLGDDAVEPGDQEDEIGDDGP